VIVPGIRGFQLCAGLVGGIKKDSQNDDREDSDAGNPGKDHLQSLHASG
jgi:hypothetical protein